MKNILKGLRENKVFLYGAGVVIGGVITYKITSNILKEYPVNPKKARKIGAY